MTPEDFSDGPDQSHPEVSQNPEASLPATELTKQALLDVALDKLQGARIGLNGIGMDLRVPPPETGTISLWQPKASHETSTTAPNELAQIVRHESPAELHGMRLNTGYTIVRSPDGLQIEKHVSASDPDIDRRYYFASQEEKGKLIAEGAERNAKTRKAIDDDREAGLGFVSELDAKNLLALVRSAEPFK